MLATLALVFAPAHWRLADAGCSNPAYVLTDDEKAFVAAIHTGETVDRYLFETATDGTYETRYTVPGAVCVGTSTLHADLLDGSRVRLTFGPMTWKSESASPNTTLTCHGQEQGDVEDGTSYELTGDSLVFVYPASPTSTDGCGNYRMVWKRETGGQ